MKSENLVIHKGWAWSFHFNEWHFRLSDYILLMLIHLQSHYLLHQRKALKLDFFDRYSWRLAFHISVL